MRKLATFVGKHPKISKLFLLQFLLKIYIYFRLNSKSNIKNIYRYKIQKNYKFRVLKYKIQKLKYKIQKIKVVVQTYYISKVINKFVKKLIKLDYYLIFKLKILIYNLKNILKRAIKFSKY
jgi:hypothetical protein